VAAIVVNYNAAPHLGACVRSIRANGVDDVVVIDNGSVDDSCEVVLAAGARWVPMPDNVGYGRGANRGAATPEGQAAAYLLVCNPDIQVSDGAVAALVASLSAEPDLGVVGPRLSNPDGSLYPSARTFPNLVDALGHGLLGLVAPRNRFTRRYRMLDWDHGRPARVDWVSGACFLARREAWDAIGGFDPVYFMYMEDVDLCWRLGRAGWGVGYQPGAEVVHVQGVSTNYHPYRMLAAHHSSMWKFANRTTEGAERAALPLVAVGLVARLVVATVRHFLGDARSRGGSGQEVDP
jgi:N-acetylglucosaminyl-diphospho-decaprenol L-rhamnosyltransferase